MQWKAQSTTLYGWKNEIWIDHIVELLKMTKNGFQSQELEDRFNQAEVVGVFDGWPLATAY